ncbi:hypothetical protein PT974_11385 [Cladobotryum mycophilum]|uniref:Spray n=1 Tax=Cladobotryum mycophilum TaxID=491253 RepID=A0ABR0S6E6_9HYPO
MAYYNGQGGQQPFTDPFWDGPPAGHQLNHRISNISEISDIDNPYDPTDPSGSHQLRGRESIVSIDSEYDRRSSAGYVDYSNYSNHNNNYASPPAAPATSSWGSFSYSNTDGGYAPTMPESIEEESYDLSLLQRAAPMGTGKSKYEAILEEEEEEEHGVPEFDFTVSLGPMDAHDAEFIRKLQEQEAKGNLTGGLGQGFRAETKVRGADLLSSPGSLQRSMSKSFARRMQSKSISRAETLRYIGQDEANRRGKVIEVIMEEPAGADLSQLEGPDMFTTGDRRRTTIYAKEQASQVFYPQPNWKPFSMQWPYLVVMVVLSLGLGVMQEVLFQIYKQDPLIKFKSPNEIDSGLYFAVKFAPTLSAVVYGVLWQFTDFEVRRLEAFYQLSKKGGALAAESINLDYATSFNFFRPFRALKKGHYAVALSSIATILAVSLVPTFAAACVVLSPSRSQRLANPDGYKWLNFSPLFSRLLTSTLVIIAALGGGLFYLLQSRRSGLLSDVRGIAGLASMAVVSHILMDFKDMDTAKHDDIHHRLKYNRYVLRNSSLAPDDDNPATSKERDMFQDHHLSAHPHPLMLRKGGLISMIIGLIVFTGFIPAFLFSPAIIVTDKAPWVVTAMAVCLKMAWGGMETAVRMMEPYYILSRRHASPKTLLLDYTALPFGYMPIRALLNGHILVFLVGFGSIMAEFLTILVTGLATVDGHDFLMEYKTAGVPDADDDDYRQINSGQETVRSFYVSVILSLFILLYMSSVAISVLVRRRHPFLPRQPNTIASVLAYIHQSKMLYNFVGTAKLSNAEMLRKLEEDGRTTYGLGWFVGRDGQKHCGVDQEELISNYKHGIDFLQGIQPWNTRWDEL